MKFYIQLYFQIKMPGSPSYFWMLVQVLFMKATVICIRQKKKFSM